MKKFTVRNNKYLDRDIIGYYHLDYVGYQQEGNPDFINHLKNAEKKRDELDLVEDFIKVYQILSDDIKKVSEIQKYNSYTICTVPRSKAENNCAQSQLMFRKAVSSVANELDFIDGTMALKRIKNTKTTHNWRLKNNTGDSPYVGITKDTCKIDKALINNKNIILIDDIYTEGVNVIEDCVQTLFDAGAKSVILYVIAKTKG